MFRPMRNSLQQFVRLHRELTAERGTLEARLRMINEALGEMPLPSLSAVGGASGQSISPAGTTQRGRRTMSAAARARIAAAQRARWAKQKGGQASISTTSAGGAVKPKRRMSAAGRKAIAEGARKRWAAAKAAGRSRL
jgi:hypothetical protein